jgi:hypothetical protein
LLAAIAFALSAGPHPCHAEQPAPPMEAVADHAPCHGGEPEQKAPPQGHDCCDPLQGGHAMCDQACQGSAVLGVAPDLSAGSSLAELAAAVQERPVPLFALSIDHVPLS